MDSINYSRASQPVQKGLDIVTRGIRNNFSHGSNYFSGFLYGERLADVARAYLDLPRAKSKRTNSPGYHSIISVNESSKPEKKIYHQPLELILHVPWMTQNDTAPMVALYDGDSELAEEIFGRYVAYLVNELEKEPMTRPVERPDLLGSILSCAYRDSIQLVGLVSQGNLVNSLRN